MAELGSYSAGGDYQLQGGWLNLYNRPFGQSFPDPPLPTYNLT
jgi:hypothetical protein